MATAIITGLNYPANLIYYNNKLYVFSSVGATGVSSYNTDGTGGTSVITGYQNVNGMTQLYNGSFYIPDYTTSPAAILKYNLTGGKDATFSVSISYVIAIAIANNVIYTANYNTTNNNVVKTYNISGGDATNDTFLTAPGRISALAISGNTLYVSTDATNINIYFYNITSTPPTLSVTIPVSSGAVYGMVLDYRYLYTTNNSGYVNIYNKYTGGVVYTLSIQNAAGLRGIALDNNYIYVCNQVATDGKVYKIANPYYTPIPCFLEGSKILQYNPETQTEQYVPIETLRTGDLIKTSASGYKAISHIGKKDLPDPATNQDKRDLLYVFDSKWASEDLGPLCITGRHCLLHTKLSESEIEKVKQFTGDIYITENKYRVPAYLDSRREPYTKTDPVVIWHFALENDNIYKNYGVYANGLLVESSSIEYMTDHSNMELL